MNTSCVHMQGHLVEAEWFPGQQNLTVTILIILTYQNKEQIWQKAVLSLEKSRVIDVKAGRVHLTLSRKEKIKIMGF